jgi:hypothetical protein
MLTHATYYANVTPSRLCGGADGCAIEDDYRLEVARNEEASMMEENLRRTARRSPQRRLRTTSCLLHKKFLSVRLSAIEIQLTIAEAKTPAF